MFFAILIAYFIGCGEINSSSVITFDGTKKTIMNFSKIFYEKPGNELTLKEIKDLKEEEWKEGEFAVFSQSKSEYCWIKIRVNNKGAFKECLIAGWPSSIFAGSIFYPLNKKWISSDISNEVVFYEGKLKFHGSVAMLSLPIGEETEVYLRLKQKGKALESIILVSVGEGIAEDSRVKRIEVLSNIFYIFILIIIIFMYVMFRDVYFLNFFMFIFFALLDFFQESIVFTSQKQLVLYKALTSSIMVTFHLRFMRDIVKSVTRSRGFNLLTYFINFGYVFSVCMVFVVGLPFFKYSANFFLFLDSSLYRVTLVILSIFSRRYDKFFSLLLVAFMLSSSLTTLALLSMMLKVPYFLFSPPMDHFLGVAEDFVAMMILLMNRFYVLRGEYAVLANAENFMIALRESGNLRKIFEYMLNNMKRHFNYDRSYLFIEGKEGMEVGASVPKSLDCPALLLDIVKTGNFEEDVYLCKDAIKEFAFKPEWKMATFIVVKMSFMENVYGYTVFTSEVKEGLEGDGMGFVKDYAQKGAMVIEHFNKAEIIHNNKAALKVAEDIRDFQKGVSHEISIPLFAQRDQISSMKRVCQEENIKSAKMDELFDDVLEANKFALDQVEESLSLVGAEDSTEFKISYLKSQMAPLRKLCAFSDIDFEIVSGMTDQATFFGPAKSIKNLVNIFLKNSVESFERLDTPKDNQKITVFMFKDGEDLDVRITENGKGLKKDLLDSLFGSNDYEPTSREDKRILQSFRLADSIVNRMNGTLSVDSLENEFTNISFKISPDKK